MEQRIDRPIRIESENERRNEVGNRRSTFKWMWEKIKSRGRKTHHKVLATRVRTMVCYRFPSPRSDEERARERDNPFPRKLPRFLPRATVALKARNIVTRTGFHCDIDAFRNREDGYVSGKWSHARHSRLIAAKLARSPTIRWNFRNFLLDHRSALVALRPNHGLECCWKWAGWFSTIIEFVKRSDLSLRVKFFVFSTFCKSWSEDVVLRLWRGMGKGNRLLIEVDGNILISRSEFLEFFGNFSLSKLIAQSGLSFLFIVKFYYSGILLGSLLKCILEGEEGG